MASSATHSIPVVPDETELRDSDILVNDDNAQQERAKRIFNRLDYMLEFKRPYEIAMNRSYLFYEGISRIDPEKKPDIPYADLVQPFAAIFVETKTAKEYSATSDFEYLPIDDEEDMWRVELNMECVDHVRRATFAQANKLDGIRTKNIAGVSIKRKGYKLIMRTLKEPQEEDEFGRMIKWKEEEVPWFDDIFEELIDPFDFVVDPAATNMNNAIDCGLFHSLNWEDAYEQFGKDKRFNFKGIKPGLNNMVDFFEYFNGPRDEWCMLAWPSTGRRYEANHTQRPASFQEVYFGPLPDEHKLLPFTSQHTNPSFITGFFEDVIGTSPESGEETSQQENIRGKRTFWTPGIPLQIADLIDQRTSFGRQALEALKVAATNIIATKDSARFNNRKKWKNGEQAIGMMGKFEVVNGTQAHVSDFDFHFNDLYSLMVQRTGVDPRNITDTRQKTLGQDLAEREESSIRLNAEIEYNEIIEGTRDGYITYKLIQQHYTKMEMVRLTGKETADELEKYDETKGTHPLNGGPLIGKRYRRIRTKKPLVEFKIGQKNMLKNAKGEGKYSFPARKEFIQMSEVEIVIVPKRRAGQIQALLRQQATDDMNLWLQFLPFTQPNPQTGVQPALSIDQLPNFDRMVQKWVLAANGSVTKDIGNNKKDDQSNVLDDAKKVLTGHTPFNAGMGQTPPVSGAANPQMPDFTSQPPASPAAAPATPPVS